jgi:hypothetical protein
MDRIDGNCVVRVHLVVELATTRMDCVETTYKIRGRNGKLEFGEL